MNRIKTSSEGKRERERMGGYTPTTNNMVCKRSSQPVMVGNRR